MAPDAATAATAAAMRRYAALIGIGEFDAGQRLFVKIDSTGRGHIRATVEAVLAALPSRPSRVVVCPAYPLLGRTVLDGCVYVDGEPLPGGGLRDLFSGLLADSGLFIAAAQTDEHLATLVRDMDDDVLWVGSAGLARHVADRVAIIPRLPPTRDVAAQVQVIVGSRHRRTIAQLARLDKQTMDRVIRIDPRDRSFFAKLKPRIAAADGLVLTGGRTARTVLDLLGVTHFAVGGEVELGVPWGVAEVDGRRIAVVTKAGGFGHDTSLQRAVDFLTQPAIMTS